MSNRIPLVIALLMAAVLGGVLAWIHVEQKSLLVAARIEREELAARAEQLRAEVAAFATSSGLTGAQPAPGQVPPALTPIDDPVASERQQWLDRVQRLQALFAERPDKAIPELRLLTDRDWLAIARRVSFDTDEGTRKALASARSRAKSLFTAQLNNALRRYTKATMGHLPADLSQLVPHFDQPPAADMLQRYTLTRSGKVSDGPADHVIEERSVVDPDYDSFHHVQASGGYGANSGTTADISGKIQRAMNAYRKTNAGSRPNSLGELLPYFDPPLNALQQQRLSELDQQAKQAQSQRK